MGFLKCFRRRKEKSKRKIEAEKRKIQDNIIDTKDHETRMSETSCEDILRRTGMA